MASLRNDLHAYVKYSATNEIIPMVLLIRTEKSFRELLRDGKWMEVPMQLCCDDVTLPPVNENPNQLKAFIKYDKRGIVVAGSTIVRKKKPADTYGTWVQIPYNRCCEVTTTTTTTTTTSTTTTTTSSTTTTTTTLP